MPAAWDDLIVGAARAACGGRRRERCARAPVGRRACEGAIAHLENPPDHTLSALRTYVGALVGEEVVAVIDGRRFPLPGV
jgi:hypothetical protein